MNSMYGFMGSSMGMLPCLPIAASVTAIGRQTIATTKETLERCFPGSRVVYGDTGKHFAHDAIQSVSLKAPRRNKIDMCVADSVMVCFGVGDDMHEAFRLGSLAEDLINSKLKAPMEIELENCYNPFYLYKKKIYAAIKWTKPDAPDGVIYKGLMVVRRETPDFVKAMCKGVLQQLLERRDVDAAIFIVREGITQLLTHKVPMEALITSMKLGSEYKMPKPPAHVHVATQMEKRMPGSAPKPGMNVSGCI